MTKKEFAERLNVINEKLEHIGNLIIEEGETIKDVLVTIYKLADDLEKEEELEAPTPSVLYNASALDGSNGEWIAVADVLPPEGEMVLARWCDGVVSWGYYKKSVEYPGAFCFYDQMNQAVTAPKEWFAPKEIAQATSGTASL